MSKVTRIQTFLPRQFELFPVEKVTREDFVQPFYTTIIHCDSIDEYARKVALLTLIPLGNTLPVLLYYDQIRILPSSQGGKEKVDLDGQLFNKCVHYTFRILAFLSYKETFEATHLPYLILPATKEGKVAWDEILRTYELPYSIQIEEEHFKDFDLNKFQDRAIFEGTQPWTDRPFIPLQFRPDLKVKKFKDEHCSCLSPKRKLSATNLIVTINHKKFHKVDFEKINLDSALLEMRNIPPSPSMGFLRGKQMVELYHYSTLPVLCTVGALSAGILCSARLLPSILTAYERVLLVRQFQSDVLQDVIIDEHKLIQSLTVPSAMMECDYQQLEFLGDCILKLIVSCIVFCNDGEAGEGELTQKRTRSISNEHLTIVSERLHVAQHVFGPEAIPKHWQAHGLWQRSLLVSDKMSADLIEAILGAAWSSGKDATIGLRCALDCFNKLHIHQQRVSLEDFHKRHEMIWRYKQTNLSENPKEHVRRIESILGYTFTYPQMALAAFTHSSISSILQPSYQRLEFLGDSVLDVCVVQLFNRIYPTLDEGQFSTLKGVAVSNLSLSIACINTGLPELILHDCKSLNGRIIEFRSKIQFAKMNYENLKANQSMVQQPFWTCKQVFEDHFPCPKQVSDIVESVLGAVFVDSGFDLEAARRVFVRVFEHHFLTYFGEGKVV